VQYIGVICFVFGIVANTYRKRFATTRFISQIGWTIFVITLTILLASPLGGMLWIYHDMQAGFFQDHWMFKLVEGGIMRGFFMGWYIVFLAFPYNLLCAIGGFFILKKGNTYLP
jgi:hypothetical protein